MAGRRLTAYYIVLLAAVAVVATYVLSVGAETEPQTAIAGGYDVSPGEACLGEQVDLRQSGQFVSMQRADGSTVGKLRFENDRLTGDVSCLEGGKQPLEAEHSGQRFVGTVGDEELQLDFARDPPDPGAQKPAPPGNIRGDYKFVPRSACLGGKGELTGPNSAVELEAAGGVTASSRTREGKVSGTVTCAVGEEAEVAGTATNRDLVLTVGEERDHRPEAARVRPHARRLLLRDRGGDAVRPARRHAGGQARPAARDGRGAGRASSSARRSSARCCRTCSGPSSPPTSSPSSASRPTSG